MKTLVAIVITVLVLVPTAFATGQALDPRVPGLQRQVKALNTKVNVLSGQLNATADAVNGKVDKSCIQIVSMVVRPGYVMQGNNGTIFVYKAFDEYDSTIDGPPNRIMQYGC